MKLKKSDVGRFVRVFYDDVGATDGILTQVIGPDDFRFLPLFEKEVQSNNGAPAIKLGNSVSAKHSGLD
jgi:hypothetical protein